MQAFAMEHPIVLLFICGLAVAGVVDLARIIRRKD